MSVSTRRSDIPVAPFREAFLRLEAGAAKGPGHLPKDAAGLIAERLGWYDRGALDCSRVRRVLGLLSYPVGGARCADPTRRAIREQVTHDMALRLCKAMDLDPVDVGL